MATTVKWSGLQLPISRIRTIMKSSPDVENIGQDSLFLIAKAAVRNILLLELCFMFKL